MMSEEKSNPTLLNFFIFNSQLGQKEGHEEEKLLYYHPKGDNLDTQVKHVGLCEAIVRFAGTFNQENDCECFHTQKKHQVLLQPEPNIWMVLTVSVGWVEKQKDGVLVREYQSEAVQDSVLKAHLQGSYDAFCFHNHSITYKSVKEGLDSVKQLLWQFYDDYIPQTDLSCGNILSIWRGLSFLPSDKQNFLRVHCVLSLVQSSLPTVIHTALLYDGNFVWCGFGMKDLQPIFYHLKSLLSKQANCSRTPTCSSGSSDGCFQSRGGSQSELVYLHNKQGELHPYQLVIYNKDNISVCITFPKSQDLNAVIFEKISRLLDNRLEQVSIDIQNQLKNQGPSHYDDFKYIYHNQMNLATKTSVIGSNTIPVDAMLTIVDMHHDLLRNESSELVCKTAQNFWIVGRMSNGRESFVIVNQKSANLIEVSDQVTKLCASHFNNIFMIE